MFLISKLGLVRPRLVRTDSDPKDSTFAKFVVSPLERGYGHTLGAPLRTILLQAFSGSSVTALRYEKSTVLLPTGGDILDRKLNIQLNLKELKFTLVGEEAEWTVAFNGPATLMAKDFCPEDFGKTMEPMQVIASLHSGEYLEFKVRARKGRRYSAAATEKMTDEWIALDCLFSPILAAQYEVKTARLGTRMDYDELILEIHTDGSVTPRNALMQTARIIRDQILVFAGNDYVEEDEPMPEEQAKQEPAIVNQNLYKQLDEFELSVRSLNCLNKLNLEYVWQLAKKTEHEIWNTRNMGTKSVKELSDLLRSLGLTFGMSLAELKHDLDSAVVKERELEIER